MTNSARIVMWVMAYRSPDYHITYRQVFSSKENAMAFFERLPEGTTLVSLIEETYETLTVEGW